ncbi:MAG: response regulator [Verrucomicrobiota bacterium]
MSRKDDFALVGKPAGAVEKSEPASRPVLSRMVADTLALVKQERQIRPRIVVVDDEPVILEIIENLIRSWFEDAAVLLFQDGQAAWGELLRTDPDLLITDS